MIEQKINWKEFWLLTVAGFVGVIALIPYLLTLQAEKLKELPIPLAILLPIQLLQNAVFIAVAVGLGLLLAGKVGLGAPLIEGWLAGVKTGPQLRKIIGPSVLAGVVLALLLSPLDLYVFQPGMPAGLAEIPEPPIWQRFLASFYGGITEEIFMRLFLFSLLAWLIAKLSHTAQNQPSKFAFWAANLLTAVIFGLGHLPAAAAITSITALIVVRVIIMNSVAGIVFGYLYWKRGLEAAIIAHFSIDNVGHVILPLLGLA